MASELTELAYLASENLLRERGNEALQTFIDDWSEALDLDAELYKIVREIDLPGEPRRYHDVVSFHDYAVVGFVTKRGETGERTIFS